MSGNTLDWLSDDELPVTRREDAHLDRVKTWRLSATGPLPDPHLVEVLSAVAAIVFTALRLLYNWP